MSNQYIVVMTNVSGPEIARTIALELVGQGLAACVNCMPGVQSVYSWEGVIEEATEVALLIKTTAASYDQVQRAIKSLHPYTVPEIIALPIVDGLPEYLQWIGQQTNES